MFCDVTYIFSVFIYLCFVTSPIFFSVFICLCFVTSPIFSPIFFCVYLLMFCDAFFAMVYPIFTLFYCIFPLFPLFLPFFRYTFHLSFFVVFFPLRIRTFYPKDHTKETVKTDLLVRFCVTGNDYQ